MLIDELATYLHEQDVVVFTEDPGGNCFIEKLPQEPEVAVALYNRGGDPSDSKLGYVRPTIQVIVRGGADPRPAFEWAQQVYDALHGLRNLTLPGGTWLVSCLGLQSGPVSLGRNERDQYEYSLNFQTETKHVTALSAS